ncbi:MAG: FixH family protein [Woeseiaceae bacterium]
MHSTRRINLLLALCLSVATYAQDAKEKESWLTRSGYYNVSYTSELTPLTINKIHRWILHIEDASGEPVSGAVISVTGGMPEHNHGLPTSPRMTDSLGNGNYVLEGMRFHMNGYWELTVTVEAGGRRDTVVISLTI